MARGDDAAAPAGPAPLRLFYDDLVTEAELRQVYALQGIEQEIAFLRLRLKKHFHAHPEDHELMLKSVGSIVRAVSVRYRIGDKRTKDLASALMSVVETVGEQFDRAMEEEVEI